VVGDFSFSGSFPEPENPRLGSNCFLNSSKLELCKLQETAIGNRYK